MSAGYIYREHFEEAVLEKQQGRLKSVWFWQICWKMVFPKYEMGTTLVILARQGSIIGEIINQGAFCKMRIFVQNRGMRKILPQACA
ncbi:hypothetical protein [Desulfopila aestuarii]|uniref:Uncharacterized protein n=1 Tax=Desulfopila aestuarii DSM 18488 TaxID=1121416 RepID=A0A1M7Y8U7_9BACT|nr:hypothetical protein [Desulfopila aestuarii]SHO48976.1 hypothetical protein SAMN02745220_02577 [Desulfopila aestuarii DSM 18488]